MSGETSSDPRSATYLTAEVPGIGGRIKVRPEDFLVEELPAYQPSGEGEHLYMFIQKVDLSTGHMVRVLADHFRVHRNAVGVAGLKDKLAVTTQLVSVHLPGKAETDFPSLQHAGLSVLWTDRHLNKLRRGHLAGNRFVIRVRDAEPSRVVHAYRSMRILASRGVPNRIGEQRFGMLGNNHLVGRALLKFDHRSALDHLLGPSASRPEFQADARRAYAQGQFQEAFERMPRSAHTERRVLSFLARATARSDAVGGSNIARDACRVIEPMEYTFFLTALQSAAFNRVLDRRLADATFDRLLEGDLAFKHDNGAVFRVDQTVLADEATSRRLRAIEISPSGPMWGAGMTRAGIDPAGGDLSGVGEMERAALAELGVTPEDFEEHARRAGGDSRRGGKGRSREPSANYVPGVRRPLRVPLSNPDIEAGTDEHGAYIKCVFELQRGAFATTVMREIMKSDDARGSDDPSEPEEQAE